MSTPYEIDVELRMILPLTDDSWAALSDWHSSKSSDVMLLQTSLDNGQTSLSGQPLKRYKIHLRQLIEEARSFITQKKKKRITTYAFAAYLHEAKTLH